MQKIVDKYKEAINEADDLRSYNKSVEDATKEITSLEKQLLALQGNDTEEGRANKQSVEKQLQDARQNLDDIEWDKLPERFVLKCNHGCAYNILCANKENFDISDAMKKMRKWMHEDFGAFNIETHYSKIKPHITCEEYLGDCIIDYKFFCFKWAFIIYINL